MYYLVKIIHLCVNATNITFKDLITERTVNQANTGINCMYYSSKRSFRKMASYLAVAFQPICEERPVLALLCSVY